MSSSGGSAMGPWPATSCFRGLLLDAGASLQIDDGPSLDVLRFSTCVPAGCIVQLTLDEGTVAALRGGAALKSEVRSTDQKEAL
ncbi:invasion associated locus B family protein [Mesorhizobium ciceri]|uniref:Invasion associated locus B family protein n=1 Tax=Mesorhizobium ciceri TaxID=39645 RepID=A0AB38TNE2_9HYPH|nr:invasion associated locus B family protein [Mesorhizobium ciceri]